MGKSILLITLGISVIISLFILKLNANSKEGLDVSVNMFEQTQARLIANSGVEIFLEKLKADKSMLDDTFPDNSLLGGEYDISIQGPDTMIKVTSIARFQDATHKTIVYAKADKIPMIPGPGAMYLNASTVSSFKNSGIGGSVLIDGRNHDIDGIFLNDGINSPGIAVSGDTQRDEVIDMIKSNAIDQVIGTGTTPNVITINNETDWNAYALQLVENPDIIIDTQDKIQTMNNWGTVSDPKVTFVNGDISINNSVTANGCGILVVNGNLSINGDFTYKGLIIAYKETTIEIKLSGTGKIIGGLVVAGQKIVIEVASGNFSTLYSLPTMNHVASLLKTNRFQIVSWWE
ncbi:MAG TPA: hypothetical protein DHV28_03545 [Ignavibacteriales bacterium]|nr:hypothetical protein [Ignavibacteriales bacterium]